MKTKYRIKSSGSSWYLQYPYEIRILFTIRIWFKVWKPFYNEIYLPWEWEIYIFGDKDMINDFVNQYPDITDYFKWAKYEQKRMEREYKS